jgi:hypothetical protein
MKKIILISVLFLVTGFLFSQIRMEGFYEAQFGRSFESDQFEWNIWDPNFYLETRFYANPIQNTDLFFKFYSNKDNDNYKFSSKNAEAVMSEGHISFRQEKKGYGFNSVLFFRESGHFWTDSSLLGIVNTGSVNNDGNAQGARFDLWHPHSGSFTYVFSDYSSGIGDDVHLLRYRQGFWQSKLHTGIFYQRKHYSGGQRNQFNEVIATDFRVNLNRYYINTEFAYSQVPSDTLITKLTQDYYDKGWKSLHKSNFAAKTELSGFRIGKAQWGYWFFTPGFYSYGNTYTNYMGENKSNEIGYWINSYYLVPQRAITISVNYSGNQRIIGDEISVQEITANGVETVQKEVFNPQSSLYTELYAEFINGFKGKFYFNKRDQEWQGIDYRHYDLFWELSVENRLAKLLTQFKLKDIGETWEKQIAGIELSVNLSDRWKLFTRGMIANDRARSRHSFFAEIQYRTGGNTEFYLQYGPSWWGSYGLVNDDGFASSGEMKKEIKLIVKGWF